MTTMKSPVWLAGSFILLLALAHVAQVSSAPTDQSVHELRRMLEHINNILAELRAKRGCVGYMCSYSHMSGHAGGAALKNKIAKLFLACAGNPNCVPGEVAS